MKGQHDQIEEWKRILAESLADVPRDYPECYHRIGDMSRAFHAAIGNALQERLNSYLPTLPQQTLQEKRDLAQKLNEELRTLNLCIRCPQTGLPGILIADYRDAEEHTSRFRIQSVDEAGQVHRHGTSRKIPPLTLLQSPVREEHFSRRGRGADRAPGRQ